MKIGDIVTLSKTAPIGRGFKVKIVNIRENYQNKTKYFCEYPHDDNIHSGVYFGFEFDYNDIVGY